MKQIIAQKGERLDTIVFKEYGTLAVFDKVLLANKHLKSKVLLEDGDIVYLPTISTSLETIKEVKALW